MEEWDALGEDSSSHAELQEGVLIVSPKPMFGHQRAALRVAAALDAAAPAEFDVVPEVDVIIEARTPATVRAPDVAVLRAGTRNPIHAEKVVLVVEVLSPGTRRTDLVMKRHEYAEAGIPHYWIVDLDGDCVRLEMLTLVDGAYESSSYTGAVETSEPFDVRLDLDALR
ncbi:Uma2 family endonuclease [Tsukamurella sputi]|uniref:Uma2 family endonuclease n=1 Tax=Tsukamurella sputi TaxID=2591848 RepID=A0A5C5RSM4_9ACTN|nr:Uma2 family endonuclease [Tsukamurella sputi]